jgi:hypothetical protein
VHGGKQFVAANPGDADVQRAGQPPLRRPVQLDSARQRRGQRAVQPVPQAGEPVLRSAGQVVLCQLGRGAERGDQGDVLGARAQPAFLPAAVDHWLQRGPGPHVKDGDPLWRVHLVPDHGQQVCPQRGHVDGDLADRLGGVHVQQPAMGVHGVRDLADRLQRPGLVVGQHHRHQHRDGRRTAG